MFYPCYLKIQNRAAYFSEVLFKILKMDQYTYMYSVVHYFATRTKSLPVTT